MMASVAVAEKPQAINTVRRFELPDLDRHGLWMIKRLLVAYPHLNERQLIGWLRALIYNNEFLFLFQEHSVALAQSMRPDSLAPRVIVYEKFVWAQSAEYEAEAALFYERFAVWAKQQDAEQIIVEEQTDVSHELIRAQLGRLLERKQVYCRL
jgi:hypothetical protein